MDLGLTGKKVLVTASSWGIGFATANSFLQEGADVLLNGRNKEKLLQSCEVLQQKHGTGRVHYFIGDMAQEDNIIQCRDYVEKVWGKLDILVPNLGSGKPVSDNRLDINEWKTHIDVNLLSVVKAIQVFLDLLPSGGNSSIILLSSITACERMGAPYAYAAAKNAVRTLCNYLAGGLADKAVRVNCVVPGNIFFPGGRWEELCNADKEGTENYINTAVPMKRFGKPEEIADAIVFLASERAGFITGAELVIDGGQKRSY